jgi:hypothetical protein
MGVEQRPERFRELTGLGVVPSPSGGGALLLHSEVHGDCYLVTMVMREADGGTETAVVTLVGCEQSVFGYPNDEAWARDPRGVAGDEPSYGFYEVLSSAWPARLAAYNRHAFPDTALERDGLRHYFVACHDASGEFLAHDLRVELPGTDFTTAAHRVMERLLE